MKTSQAISYRPPLIIGHRGNSGNPLNTIEIENTIESVDSAWDVGADGIELDVQMTRDGVLVPHHDDYLGRVFRLPDTPHFYWHACVDKQRIVECTYSELQSAKSELDPKARIPRLEEILPIPEGKLLFLELKFPGNKPPTDTEYLQRLVRKVVDLINEHKLQEQVIVISFVGESLNEVKNLNSNIRTGIDVCRGEAKSGSKIQELKKSYGINCILPPFGQVSQILGNTIMDCHCSDLEVYPWVWKQNTYGEVRKAIRLIEMGADGIITNQVGILKAFVKESHI